jgi:4-hydroxybenzoate polyprenyltransferase
LTGQTLSWHTTRTHLSGLLRLSRWQEHLPFTVPATLLGVNMAAAHSSSVTLDGRVIGVLLANCLAVTWAFMINDIEDAPDDARDADRAARNPVACGELTPRQGWLAATGVALLALSLYAGVSLEAFGVGALTVTLALLYSWRRVRLKALPVLDVVAHVLMLSALLFLAGYMAYDAAPGRVWLVTLGVALVSAYGQFYNQVRDNAMDRAAGLHNTAHFVGPDGTRRLMIASLAAAVVCLGITVIQGLWPLWLALVPAGMAPLVWLARSGADMRGTQAIDASGRIQLGAMLVATVTMGAWLLALVAG